MSDADDPVLNADVVPYDRAPAEAAPSGPSGIPESIQLLTAEELAAARTALCPHTPAWKAELRELAERWANALANVWTEDATWHDADAARAAFLTKLEEG